MSQLIPGEPEILVNEGDCNVTNCFMCAPLIESEGTYACPNKRLPGRVMYDETPLEVMATSRTKRR